MNVKLATIGLAATFICISAYAQENQESQQGQQVQSQATEQEQMQSQAMTTASASVVRRVQQRLHDQGYNAGPVDGKWGPNTQQALRQYQQTQGLNATGNIDTQTLSSLGFSRADIAAFEQRQKTQRGMQQPMGGGQQPSPSRQQNPPQGGQGGRGGNM